MGSIQNRRDPGPASKEISIMATSLRNPGHLVLSATRARQGRYGRHVLWVLLVSTALAALALFGTWTWQAPELASTEPHNATQPADAQQKPSSPKLP
jgi:hypothetical protein